MTAAGLWHRAFDTSETELHAMAATAYLVMARTTPSLAADVERGTLRRLAMPFGAHAGRRAPSFEDLV